LRIDSSHNQADEDIKESNEKAFSALAAQERAQRIASLVGSHSAPASRRNSLEGSDDDETSPRPNNPYPVRIDDIPLVEMDSRRAYDGARVMKMIWRSRKESQKRPPLRRLTS